MSGRKAIDIATDVACGVGNTYGGSIFEGRTRDQIELGLRRLTAAGYSILAPGEVDAETVERCAQEGYRVCAETRHVTLGDKVAAVLRALVKEPGR